MLKAFYLHSFDIEMLILLMRMTETWASAKFPWSLAHLK